MKKFKNVAILAVAIILLCAISVGGTVAYLAATTGTLINTMVAGEFGNIYLQEVGDDGSQDIKWFTGIGNKHQNDYTVVPGVDINKDPKVKFEFNDGDVVNAYIYVKITYDTSDADNGWTYTMAPDTVNGVKVSGTNGTLTAKIDGDNAMTITLGDNWRPVKAGTSAGTIVLCYAELNSSGTAVDFVSIKANDNPLLNGISVFKTIGGSTKTIDVSSALEVSHMDIFQEKKDNYNLSFSAYAIQTQGFTVANAWTAVKDMK